MNKLDLTLPFVLPIPAYDGSTRFIADFVAHDPKGEDFLILEYRDESGDVLSGHLFRAAASKLRQCTRDDWERAFPPGGDYVSWDQVLGASQRTRDSLATTGVKDTRLIVSRLQQAITSKDREIKKLEESMRRKLTAISIVASANTPETHTPPLDRGNLGWSQAYQDTWVAVDREIRDRRRADYNAQLLSDSEKKRDELKSELANSENRAAGLSRDVDTLVMEGAGLREEIKRLKAGRAVLEQQLAGARHQNDSLHRGLNEENEKSSALRKELEQVKGYNEEQRKTIVRLQTENGELTKSSGEMNDTIHTLHNQITSLTIRITSLRKELDAADEIEQGRRTGLAQGVGFAYGHFCGTLDRGGDPRGVAYTTLVDKVFEDAKTWRRDPTHTADLLTGVCWSLSQTINGLQKELDIAKANAASESDAIKQVVQLKTELMQARDRVNGLRRLADERTNTANEYKDKYTRVCNQIDSLRSTLKP